MATRAVWLDCDPGYDDVFAILLAGHAPSLELLGISTVAGNESVEKTTLNAAKVVETSLSVPVFRGAEKPILRAKSKKYGEEGKGKTGLDGVRLPSAESAVAHFGNRKASIAMAEAILAHEAPVTIVATGALTNVALMLSLYPEVRDQCSVVFMGGAIGLGNKSPTAEFNVHFDPEATQMVLDSGVHVTMVPLEVTHTALATKEVLDRIRSLGSSKFVKMAVDCLTAFAKTYKEVYGFEAPPVHDPCAVAYVIDPAFFESRRLRVDVELVSPLCSGQTICDVFGITGKTTNCDVCVAMNVDSFWDLLLAALRKANSVSRME
jgi:inosine-uridine nucleoside N-ribohydrolase